MSLDPAATARTDAATVAIDHGGRQVLLHGLALIMVGLLYGLIVHHAPYPTLALTAHLLFISNGLMQLVTALLLLLLRPNVGRFSVFFIVLGAWLSWGLIGAEAVNAWWGAGRFLPIGAEQAGLVAGSAAEWQEQVVIVTHMVGGGGIIAAWLFLLLGFVRRPR